MHFKNMFFIILLPLFCLSSEKIDLTHYSKLKSILENFDDHSSTQIACISRSIAIPEQKTSLIHPSFVNVEQKKNIILGLYLFSAPAIPTEKESYVIEASKAFTMAFPHSTSFNFSSTTPINDVCKKLDNALWWDYYLKKIPFIQSILNIMNQIYNVNKASNKMDADLI